MTTQEIRKISNAFTGEEEPVPSPAVPDDQPAGDQSSLGWHVQQGRVVYRPGPNECGLCYGTGIIEWQENMAPDGEGYWPMAMHDYCPDCLAQGICPVCGRKTINDDWICTACSYRGPLAD